MAKTSIVSFQWRFFAYSLNKEMFSSYNGTARLNDIFRFRRLNTFTAVYPLFSFNIFTRRSRRLVYKGSVENWTSSCSHKGKRERSECTHVQVLKSEVFLKLLYVNSSEFTPCRYIQSSPRRTNRWIKSRILLFEAWRCYDIKWNEMKWSFHSYFCDVSQSQVRNCI